MSANFRLRVAEPELLSADDRPSFEIREEFGVPCVRARLAVFGGPHSGCEWPLSEAGLRVLANACLAAAEHLRVTNARLKAEQ